MIRAMSSGADLDIPEHLLRALDRGSVAPLFGAGCSAETPANLPTASQLAENLSTSSQAQLSSLEEVADRIYAEGGWQEFARALPITEWRAKPPNESHRVLAELCKEGCIQTLLTTNWDTLVERALSEIGQPHSVIVRAQSLDTEQVGPVQVIKINGCITSPEFIKATTGDLASEEWLEDWKSALFETTLRTHSLLCVGYSGASKAATSTVAQLVSSGERTMLDTVVDISSYDDMMRSDHGRDFLNALHLEAGSYVESTADAFFRAVRDSMYQLSLTYVRTESRAMLTEIARSTSVPPDELHTALEHVVEQWRLGGSHLAQQWLVTTFAEGQETQASRPYIPLRIRRTDIGRCWAWVALALWADAGQLDAADLRPRITSEGQPLVCVMSVCPPNKRRDAIAREVVLRMTPNDRISASYMGVVFDGLGPLVPDATSFSVVRGKPEPTVARGGAFEIRWQDGNQVFECFRPEATPPMVRDSLRELVSGLEPRVDER